MSSFQLVAVCIVCVLLSTCNGYCWHNRNFCGRGSSSCTTGGQGECVASGEACECEYGHDGPPIVEPTMEPTIIPTVYNCAFEYEILDEPVAWSGARDHCQAIYNSDIATISTVDDFECALYRIEELSIIESAFILLSHGERLFYDNKPCPFEQGMVAYCPKLLLLPWKNTTPMDCSMDGSRCARIIPDKGVINNDISCEETLIAVLCNPEKKCFCVIVYFIVFVLFCWLYRFCFSQFVIIFLIFYIFSMFYVLISRKKKKKK
eukprot:423624_1